MSKYALAVISLLAAGCTKPDFGLLSEATFQCESKPVTRYTAHGISLEVRSESCIEASGPLEDGAVYDWLYVYEIYHFSHAGQELTARSYHESEEAHFLRIEEAGEPRFLKPGDFESPLVLAAIGYLVESGKAELNWLDPRDEFDGYSPVPAPQL